VTITYGPDVQAARIMVEQAATIATLRAQYAAQLNLTIEAKGEIDTLRADLALADTTAANLHDEIRKRDDTIATLRADVAATIDRWAEALSEIATLRAALDGLVEAWENAKRTKASAMHDVGGVIAVVDEILATAKETP